MTREEAFRKNFPEYCCDKKCLSPYFDIFCAGLEIEKSQMYEKTVKPMQEQIENMKCCANCKYGFCSCSSESIEKDGKRTRHCWNDEKEMYCDVGNGKNAKYQCWELEE